MAAASSSSIVDAFPPSFPASDIVRLQCRSCKKPLAGPISPQIIFASLDNKIKNAKQSKKKAAVTSSSDVFDKDSVFGFHYHCFQRLITFGGKIPEGSTGRRSPISSTNSSKNQITCQVFLRSEEKPSGAVSGKIGAEDLAVRAQIQQQELGALAAIGGRKTKNSGNTNTIGVNNDGAAASSSSGAVSSSDVDQLLPAEKRALRNLQKVRKKVLGSISPTAVYNVYAGKSNALNGLASSSMTMGFGSMHLEQVIDLVQNRSGRTQNEDEVDVVDNGDDDNHEITLNSLGPIHRKFLCCNKTRLNLHDSSIALCEDCHKPFHLYCHAPDSLVVHPSSSSSPLVRCDSCRGVKENEEEDLDVIPVSFRNVGQVATITPTAELPTFEQEGEEEVVGGNHGNQPGIDNIFGDEHEDENGGVSSQNKDDNGGQNSSVNNYLGKFAAKRRKKVGTAQFLLGNAKEERDDGMKSSLKRR